MHDVYRDNYGDTYMPRFYNGWAPAMSAPAMSAPVMSAPVERLDRTRIEDALMNHERQIRDRNYEERARREVMNKTIEKNVFLIKHSMTEYI